MSRSEDSGPLAGIIHWIQCWTCGCYVFGATNDAAWDNWLVHIKAEHVLGTES